MSYNRKEIQAFWDLVILVSVVAGLVFLIWSYPLVVLKILGLAMFVVTAMIFIAMGLVPANKTYQGSPPTPEETK